MKRFWTEVAVVGEADGHGVRLDGRALTTPAKRPVRVPGRALADALAAEWAAQEGKIDPRAMPVTRAVNVTLDRVMAARGEVAGTLAAYGGADLLCYRAPHPPALVARQAAAWDPLLDWAAEHYGARLAVAEGVMHVAQPERSVAALTGAVAALDPWELTGLHDLVTLSGSLVIGLAVRDGRLSVAEGWAVSRIDEAWNIEQWGEDAEAAAAEAAKRADFEAAARLLSLIVQG